jgi:DNA-binding NtrC family response regulator
MSKPPTPFDQLSNLPIDELVPAAVDRLKHATLDELATMLAGKPAALPPLSQLAETVLTLSAKGSKLEAIENAVVLMAVEQSGGNVSAAARLLGVERKALDRKIARAKKAR